MGVKMEYYRAWIVMFFISTLAASSRIDALDTLRKAVLSKVDQNSPPHPGAGMPIDVNMSFLLSSVVDLNSKTQILTVSGSLKIHWQDPRVAWNTSEGSGHSFLELEEKDVWRPRIDLTNSADNVGPLMSNKPVVLFDTGLYRWELRAVFRVRCKINIATYPYDRQLCRLTFAPTFGYRLKLKIGNIVKSVNYEGNGEWYIGNLTHETFMIDDDIEATDIEIPMERKKEYYFFNIIAPISLMSLLNPFVFLIPARSGEKLGFLMAVFLSHIVFLNLINESMPPTSDQISNLTSFLTAIECQGFFTVLASILVIAIHHRKEKADEENSRQMTMTMYPNNEEPLKKKRRRLCCRGFSVERCLDGVFFVLSLSISFAAFSLLTSGIELNTYDINKEA